MTPTGVKVEDVREKSAEIKPLNWQNDQKYTVVIINRDKNITANFTTQPATGNSKSLYYKAEDLNEGEKYTVYVIAKRDGEEARSDPVEFLTHLNPSNYNHILCTFDLHYARLIIVIVAINQSLEIL